MGDFEGTLSAGTARVRYQVIKLKETKKTLLGLGATPLALILSACGSNTTTSSNVLSLTKSGDSYSASNVTGFSVTDSDRGTLKVANAASNSYEVKLDAKGDGTLEFDFVDASDTVVLSSGSKTSGFTTLKVTNGTVDATNADLSGITRVEVASGIKISLAQVKEIPTIVANSASSEISIEVTSEAEATELVNLISAGTVKVFADSNPIKLVAAPTATVATETLSSKQTETTASVKPKDDAPADTSNTDDQTGNSFNPDVQDETADAAKFSEISSFKYGAPTGYGDLTLTLDSGNYVAEASTGEKATVATDKVSIMQVDNIKVTANAAVIDGETVQGSGDFAVTKLEGDASADMSKITVSGAKTIAVSGNVAFTGDLGSGFTTSVGTGNTLTSTAAILTGQTINGAGTVAVSDDISDDADFTSITTTGFDFGQADVAVTTGKTLKINAAQADGELFSGAGTLNISASDSAQTIKAQTSAANTLKTGGGDDVLELGAAKLLTDADVIDMGAGTADTIKIIADGDTGANGAVFNQKDSNVEKIVVLADSDTASTHAKLSLKNSGAETDALEIDATALTDSGAKFTLALAGTAGNVDGALTVKGGADGDSITTGDGADVVDANGGSDTVSTGAGNDEITTDLVSAAEDAVDGGSGTDTLKLVGAVADASAAIVIDLRAGQTDQIASINTNWMKANQTGIENFDLSGMTVTANPGTPIVSFTNLNSTTDGETTALTGTAASTDTITAIATGSNLTAITLRGIEVITYTTSTVSATFDADNFTNVVTLTGDNTATDDVAVFADDIDFTSVTNTEVDHLSLNAGVDMIIDAANLTDVVKILGTNAGTENETLTLKEAAAFDMKAVTDLSDITSILMNTGTATATGVTLLRDTSGDFTGTLVGVSGTTQTLTAKGNSGAADITGITNTNVEKLAVLVDDDDLVVDTANLTNVTTILGVNGTNAEYVIAKGASAFDFSGVTLTDIAIKGTAGDAQTIFSAVGGNEIDLVGTGAADIIKYTFTSATEAATQVGSAAGTDNDAVSTLGSEVGDTIKNFTSGTDKIHIAASALTSAAGTEVDTLKSIAASGTVANTDRFVEITTAQSDGQMGTAITLLNGLTTSAVAIGDSFLAAVIDGSNTTLYMVEQVSAADTIAAQDVTLLSVLVGVTNVADGDFVSYA